jgi:hypothetical protein
MSEDRPAHPCISLRCLHPKLAIACLFGFITATAYKGPTEVVYGKTRPVVAERENRSDSNWLAEVREDDLFRAKDCSAESIHWSLCFNMPTYTQGQILSSIDVHLLLPRLFRNARRS